MNRDIVKLSVLLIAAAFAGGCATGGDARHDAPSPLISAADFESMISIEVRELEPLPVEEAVAAAH
jgi:hypothetical protein